MSIRRQEHEVSITNCSLKDKEWVFSIGTFIKDTFWFDFSFWESYVNNKKIFAITSFKYFSPVFIKAGQNSRGRLDALIFLLNCKQSHFFGLLFTLRLSTWKTHSNSVDGRHFVGKKTQLNIKMCKISLCNSLFLPVLQSTCWLSSFPDDVVCSCMYGVTGMLMGTSASPADVTESWEWGSR